MNQQAVLPAQTGHTARAVTGPRHRLLRGVGAVLAGFAVIVVASTATDVVLHATGVFPPWGQAMTAWLFALAAVYRTIISVAGCYLTARLAPDRPMQHALALGALGVVVSVAGTLATLGRGPAFGPIWYPLALVAVSLPCAWTGGMLARQSRQGRA
jgi:hypothetical protein